MFVILIIAWWKFSKLCYRWKAGYSSCTRKLLIISSPAHTHQYCILLLEGSQPQDPNPEYDALLHDFHLLSASGHQVFIVQPRKLIMFFIISEFQTDFN